MFGIYWSLLVTLFLLMGWAVALAILIDYNQCDQTAVQNLAIATYAVAPVLFVFGAIVMWQGCRQGVNMCGGTLNDIEFNRWNV